MALWIIELPKAWITYASIPRRTSMVMSFRISSMFMSAGKDLAFFLANRVRDIFCDGTNNLSIAALSFAMGFSYTVGFVAFENVDENWFQTVRTTPWYEPTPGRSDSFFATWPLMDENLGSAYNVKDTLSEARSTTSIFANQICSL